MKKVGLGIIGAGWIADWYYKAYQKLSSDITLVGALGNPTPAGKERLAKKCALWNCKAYDSLEALLADPAIEAVAIFTPTNLHYEQARSALLAGKHVLVEKPVTLSASEDHELNKLAKERNLVLFPGHNFVYRPVVRKAKEVVESGVLGTISYASFRACHFIPEDHATGWRKHFAFSGGGAMMDSGTHLVYQSLYLLGVPTSLNCFLSKQHYLGMDGEDTCLITLQYPDGCVGSIFQSWSANDPQAGEIRIQGDKGVLTITDALYVNGEKLEEDSSYESSFFHTLSTFREAIAGESKPLSDSESAATTLLLIQEAYRSAREQKVVAFNPSVY
jgi:predicted dehydrogenase